MSYKTILFDVNGSKRTPQNLAIAIELARRYGAHLVGAAGTCLPPAFYMPEMVGASVDQAAVYLDYMRERAQTNLAHFEAILQKDGLPSFERRLLDEEQDLALVTQSPYADLLVMGQPDPEESLPVRRGDFTEYVLLHSGRPVLLVPYAGTYEKIGGKVLVAWDAGSAATRAVTAALPLLQRADHVEVAVFDTPGAPRRHRGQPGADIALFLARHGVRVEVVERVAAADAGVGNALLSHAADSDADLLVMGAYGHARMREILLGGVTQTILASMTLPVFFMH